MWTFLVIIELIAVGCLLFAMKFGSGALWWTLGIILLVLLSPLIWWMTVTDDPDGFPVLLDVAFLPIAFSFFNWFPKLVVLVFELLRNAWLRMRGRNLVSGDSNNGLPESRNLLGRDHRPLE